MSGAEQRDTIRLLRLLRAGAATVSPSSSPGKVLIDAAERGAAVVKAETLAELRRRGLVVMSGARLELSDAGKAAARRGEASDPFQDQHRELASVAIELPEGRATATVNLNESPLAQLAQRRAKNGTAFLDEREVRAGERLRADYTRGSLIPRLGANWAAPVSGGRRGGPGGATELTDAAIAARLRVERAIAAVGPELSGVLIDVCCFLKGMETIEAERRWPVRSAKLMLKAGLGALSRHYEPVRTSRGNVLHWGAEGYRPAI